MGKLLEESYPLIINSVSEINEVVAIGKSGRSKLPEHGESDIDIYVFCSRIPEIKSRKAAIDRLGNVISSANYSERGGRFWGTIDFLFVDNTDICLMYFTTAEMDKEIELVLNGTHLDREEESFYPTGRCATMLSICELNDKSGYIARMKEHLSVYPQELSIRLFNHHMRHDGEDFDRAVSRSDVLFYHAVVENAIDHFLQALFALNKCFFPSRKRTIGFINGFDIKPLNCANRLLQTIELGAKPETLSDSYAVWYSLYKELFDLGNHAE
ncbi:MAG: DUF4037 domain-containing protein [Oscillospiraceae bacterium]|nr:DUF4037 domain-containing protein [Oscillospiraceae bacterium]